MPSLPEHVRATILTLVEASTARHSDGDEHDE
jgi:hypothetical protein